MFTDVIASLNNFREIRELRHSSTRPLEQLITDHMQFTGHDRSDYSRKDMLNLKFNLQGVLMLANTASESAQLLGVADPSLVYDTTLSSQKILIAMDEMSERGSQPDAIVDRVYSYAAVNFSPETYPNTPAYTAVIDDIATAMAAEESLGEELGFNDYLELSSRSNGMKIIAVAHAQLFAEEISGDDMQQLFDTDRLVRLTADSSFMKRAIDRVGTKNNAVFAYMRETGCNEKAALAALKKMRQGYQGGFDEYVTENGKKYLYTYGRLVRKAQDIATNWAAMLAP